MANYKITYHFTNGMEKTFTVYNSPYNLQDFISMLVKEAFTTHIPRFSKEAYIINNRNVNCVEVVPE